MRQGRGRIVLPEKHFEEVKQISMELKRQMETSRKKTCLTIKRRGEIMKTLMLLLVISGFLFFATGVANAIPDMEVRAYIIAVNHGDTAKIDSLLVNNPKLVDVPDDIGWTQLMRAVDYAKMPTVELIVSKAADINLQNPEGVTPLIFAARNGNLEMVKFLISKGANMNIKDNKGARALTFAEKRNDSAGNDVSDYLRSYGAKR
jgi:hypothetical protein